MYSHVKKWPFDMLVPQIVNLSNGIQDPQWLTILMGSINHQNMGGLWHCFTHITWGYIAGLTINNWDLVTFIRLHTYIYIYIYLCMYIDIYIYIYLFIYLQRERERERKRERALDEEYWPHTVMSLFVDVELSIIPVNKCSPASNYIHTWIWLAMYWFQVVDIPSIMRIYIYIKTTIWWNLCSIGFGLCR